MPLYLYTQWGQKCGGAGNVVGPATWWGRELGGARNMEPGKWWGRLFAEKRLPFFETSALVKN